MAEMELASAETRHPLWVPQSWLRAESLAGLAELNEQCLELLCEQAAAGVAGRPRPPLIAQLEPLWRGLDALARRRAAHCPFLLLDAGLASPTPRLWPGEPAVRDRDGGPLGGPFFTVARTVPVARLLLAYAWHLVRSEAAAARLFLGVSPRCAGRLAACTLRQVMQLAENDPRLMRPRWAHRVHIWRELLAAAAGADALGMEQFRMHGLQLLAADALASELLPMARSGSV
jgi:hypothetical protein